MLDVDVVSVRRLVTARPSLSRQAPGSGRRGLITAWPLAMASAMIPTQVRLLIAPRLQARPDKHAFGCPGSLTPRRLSRRWRPSARKVATAGPEDMEDGEASG